MTTPATDRTSKADEVALAFLAELERRVAIDTSSTAAELRTRLFALLREGQAALPSLGLVHQLAARALEVADAGLSRREPPADLRAHLAQACAAERSDLEAARAAVARTAARLVTEPEPWIASLSHRAVVRDAFVALQEKGRRPRALIAEGRPHLEGRHLAASLAAAQIPVWLVTDAALPILLSQVQMVWLGAEAVTDRGAVQPIGSFALALAAREHSVPVYALAERKKFLPAVTAALQIVEAPPEEVWKEPPDGVRPRNILFEVVPLELLQGIVVEDAVLGGTEAATTARERPLPDALAGAPQRENG